MLEQFEFSIPKLAFISETETMAVKMFKHNAIDFLLKQIDFNAIILAVYKVVKRTEMERSDQNYKINNITILNSFNQSNDHVAIASLDKIELILMSKIIFVQADGKYTIFFLLNGKKIITCRNLVEYSTLPDNNYFFRIHHSYIINLRHISKISKRMAIFRNFKMELFYRWPKDNRMISINLSNLKE